MRIAESFCTFGLVVRRGVKRRRRCDRACFQIFPPREDNKNPPETDTPSNTQQKTNHYLHTVQKLDFYYSALSLTPDESRTQFLLKISQFRSFIAVSKFDGMFGHKIIVQAQRPRAHLLLKKLVLIGHLKNERSTVVNEKLEVLGEVQLKCH